MWRATCRVSGKQVFTEEVKIMDINDIIESLELLKSCISVSSSEKHKITVLENIKPSSFEWVIESTIDYLKQVSTEKR